MAFGAFVDKDHQPTIEEILVSLGSKRVFWEDLVRFVEDNYRIQRDWLFGGTKYGWSLRFRRSGRALITLYPGINSFIVQIVIGSTVADEAFALNLGENVKKTLETAHPYHDGRWLFLRVESERDLNDVESLLLAKSKPIKTK